MLNLFPGDRLWGRYRIERLLGDGISGAWISTVPTTPKSVGSPARALLLPLSPPAHDPFAPLAGCLAEIGAAMNLSLAVPSSGRKRSQSRPLPALQSELPLFGKVEWIGENGPGGMILIFEQKAEPLPALLAQHGAFSAAQCVQLLERLARDLDDLLALVAAPAQRQQRTERLVRALSRLLVPDNLALSASGARLIIRPALQATGIAQPPAWCHWIAPELFSERPAAATALVYGAARIAGALAAGQLTPDATAERAWSEVSERASGSTDAAREFLKSAAAEGWPEPARSLLARCLARGASRRLSSPGKLAAACQAPALLAALQPAHCAACGFVLARNEKSCACCGTVAAQSSDAEGSGGGKSESQPQRPRRSGTTTILKTSSQAAMAAVAVPELTSMAIVPAGPFLSGENKTPRTLRAFAIDLTPVTEGQYKQFLAAAGKTARPGGPGSADAARDNLPVTSITWFEANEFAEFHGKRLPTIYEWEKAARGTDGRKFPFGNQFKPAAARLRLTDDKRRKPDGPPQAGSIPEGASPYGVLDMVGSVLQWTSSARRSGERLFRAIKGSCYLDGSPELARCTSIQYLPPETREAYIGFRCVKDID
ncbi:MAG TPA: SUMF1/EgtB/PvdO family nonheme iron enzyme [Planctomycetota bacterium]|nr:SUMF1/EgtB/PvdO family nonheme iron enzyme [Planctomycetota bacterium]